MDMEKERKKERKKEGERKLYDIDALKRQRLNDSFGIDSLIRNCKGKTVRPPRRNPQSPYASAKQQQCRGNVC